MRIGQLASVTGFPEKTLRYYDEIGLLHPAARTPSGYRLYAADAVERLRFVRRARGLGLSLADIRTILEIGDEGRVPCEHVVAIVDRELERVDSQRRRLRSLRGDLMSLRERLTEAIASGNTRPGHCSHLIAETSAPIVATQARGSRRLKRE